MQFSECENVRTLKCLAYLKIGVTDFDVFIRQNYPKIRSHFHVVFPPSELAQHIQTTILHAHYGEDSTTNHKYNVFICEITLSFPF